MKNRKIGKKEYIYIISQSNQNVISSSPVSQMLFWLLLSLFLYTDTQTKKIETQNKKEERER